MIRFLTAGESHGKALTVIVEGFPSNFFIDAKFINQQLKRRQSGYGRSNRMKIENDSVEIMSGIRFGKTLGSPISFLIKNKDWESWKDVMSVESLSDDNAKVTIPRPGHADLVGISKYNFNDIRNSIERSSARETAARVAAGSIARKFLENFGIYIGSVVESIGGIYPGKNIKSNLFQNKLFSNSEFKLITKSADKSIVRVIDKKQESKIISKIKSVKKKGDTLGGTFIVFATGVPVGLGSFMQYDRRIDADIASHIMSINAVKAVEIGDGFNQAEKFGSESQDEIVKKGNLISRKTNFAGGIEGSITSGLPIIVRAAMKPISTLMNPLMSIDLQNFKSVESRRERSDFVAVPACSVIGESMLAWVIAKHFMLKFGGDSFEETTDNYKNYTVNLLSRVKSNFKK